MHDLELPHTRGNLDKIAGARMGPRVEHQNSAPVGPQAGALRQRLGQNASAILHELGELLEFGIDICPLEYFPELGFEVRRVPRETVRAFCPDKLADHR